MATEMSNFCNGEEDLTFEDDISRNLHSVKHWLRYIHHKRNAPASVVNILYERALSHLPGSYKLWHKYLQFRIHQLSGKPIIDAGYKDVNNCFDRAIVFMHKMPIIWLEYCEFLVKQVEIIKARRTFDRALQALPVTQHYKIWSAYLNFVRQFSIPETCVRVYRRFLKQQPEEAEQFINYLISIERFDEAAQKLLEIVNDERFVSKEGKSKHQLWSQLAELACKNPDHIYSLDVDNILREGIKRYVDQQGKLWISLAEYYTRIALFEKARDIYEEALASIQTIRDFSQIFNAYTQSEEMLIQVKMSKQELSEEDELELDLRIMRFEDLIERRPLLLNAVALRQNPHNVEEWHKRVKLYESKPVEAVEVYSKAVDTVDPKQALGKYHTLWVEFAKFYEAAGQLDDARTIFKKATTVEYVNVDDLATVWCEWTEMEIRNDHFEEALRLMQQATAVPSKRTSYYDATESTQKRVHKSLKLWSMYADLEESFGTFQSTRAVYDKIIELKIVTPQIILNYGVFLEESGYWEDSFRAYEKGLALFNWPNVYDIWNTYLTKFLQRYKGTKLERVRDLFEQCLEECPPKYCKNFYLLFAKCEENYGLAKHSMSIYERAAKKVPKEDRAEIYNIFIRKAAELFGITYTREIYEMAIDSLSDAQAIEMCIKYAQLERNLGEIDRARAIFAHCSQMADPRIASTFWNSWKEFEMKHGNEDTIREMLRIKRSVMATFNIQVNYVGAQLAANNMENKASQLEQEITSTRDEEAQKVAEIKNVVSFVKATETAPVKNVVEEGEMANPDEINLDDDDDDEEEEDDDDNEKTKEIEQKAVPLEVFGGLQTQTEDED